MRRLFSVLVVLAALVWNRAASAEEPKDDKRDDKKDDKKEKAEPKPISAPVVDLFTIGPHSDFPSRFGHALLCVREDVDDSKHGHCYDYGVPAGSNDDMFAVGYDAMRGRPSFVPVEIGEDAAVEYFLGQGREVQKQRLPLRADETRKLTGALATDVKEKRAYAYHPYWANCTTKLRDQIDSATNGRLHEGPKALPPGTARDYFEEGHSGHIGTLTATAIFLGGDIDRPPTPWEAMLLPAELRDGVTDRFGVQPEQLGERVAVVLPTSRALGKLTIFAWALALFGVVRFLAKRGRLKIAVALMTATFGALAVSLDLVALIVKWTEMSHNWALALFWPTDLAMPFLKREHLRNYVKAKVAVAAILGALEIGGAIHQPLLPLVALVVLPGVALLAALRAQVPAATKESSASATA
jgi:hypothetical protein